MQIDSRSKLAALFEAAVSAAQPATCLPRHLPPVPARGRLIVLGAGKAAAAMALATEEHYRSRRADDRISGFVATRHGYGLPTQKIRVMEAGHPVPDEASIAAADAALDLAASATPSDDVLVLLSGGASAIWSAPVAGVTLADKQATTKALLRSGERIHEMNLVRKHLSRIKGGRLARAASRARTILTLAISDVPGDDPAVIGSGPTVADPSTLEEARAIVARLGDGAPPSVRAALEDKANESVKPGEPALGGAIYRLIAAPRISLDAAARKAQSLGYRPVMLGDALEGEARELAKAHAQLALEAREKRERVAILSGGELTVTIKGTGRGGPNQEYALALAIALEGAYGISALAADTDGADGGSGSPDDPAGAIVVSDTLQRASTLLLNPVTFLQNNDSTGFFARLGDLIVSGPTRTNVNDFRAVLIDP